MTSAAYITDDLPHDIQHTVDSLTQQMSLQHPDIAPHFNLEDALFAARAPGRLDVMGGIADYSGSTVLQLPLAESAVVLCQHAKGSLITVISAEPDGLPSRKNFSCSVFDFIDSSTGMPHSYPVMEDFFKQQGEDNWAAYCAGVLAVLMNECDVRTEQGLSIYLQSSVPEGKGVSSSAAVEVASMRAITQALGLDIDWHQQAVLCQKVENHIAGAPCGLMDQMTSSSGKKGSLLRLLCQPDTVLAPVQVPEGLQLWGIDSGLRHAVTGADYRSVRVATFIGYRLLLEQAGVAASGVLSADIVDQRWNGYLANVSVSEFSEHHENRLPEQLSGRSFIERYHSTTDTITVVDPHADYAVRACTAHPIHEHFRSRLFAQLLSEYQHSPVPVETARLLGECMYQSHAGYSSCGLNSVGTDDLVVRLRSAGPECGIYGARITGGGSGGTVAVLADAGAESIIGEIASDYKEATGIGGYVFSGTSDGASVYCVNLV